MTVARSAILALAAIVQLTIAPRSAQAGLPRACDQAVTLKPTTQDKRLQLAARVRQELQAAGSGAVLISRSGIALDRFDQRYSHAGVSLRQSPNTPWSVRQLYYACDEARPRLFDQGLAGFLLAADDGPAAQVSLLILPPIAAAQLEAAALDETLALALLAERYSANAYAFATLYQNCNQWLAELLAVAFGAPRSRAGAQGWLHDNGYAPHRFEANPLLLFASLFVPQLHHDDHPEADRAAGIFRVSMPSAIEAFVERRFAGTQRIELCQNERQIVIRRGGAPLSAACEAGPADERVRFDAQASQTSPGSQEARTPPRPSDRR